MPEELAKLRLQFDEQMLQIYTRARTECRYNATRFLAMLHEHKGVETARRLLPNMSDGYAELWRRGRLDLTVEALIIKEPWSSLFSDAELAIARDRLSQSGFALPPERTVPKSAVPLTTDVEFRGSSQPRVGPTSDVLGSTLSTVGGALRAFVETAMRQAHGDQWKTVAQSSLPRHHVVTRDFDVAALLAIMLNNWQTVFRHRLSNVDRAFVTELRDVRNRWAHQESIPIEDVHRALDTAKRLLRAIDAGEAVQRVEALLDTSSRAGSPRPSPRVTHVPEQVARPAGDPRISPLDAWLGVFASTFHCQPQRFGGTSLESVGASDDAPGVQWNLTLLPQEARAWLGVNLEGLQYDGWPIARLIEREIARPEFCTVASRIDRRRDVTLLWWRDCWQATARLRIEENQIVPTPITLDRLSEDAWLRILQEAQACLDPLRGYRGRRRRVVTLAGGQRVEKAVSPHFQVRVPLAMAATDYGQAVAQARQTLLPIYDWATDRSRP